MAPRKDGTAREAGAISLSQASTNFGHSSARLRRIKKLQFGIINPEELRQYSVTQAITVNGRKIPAGVTRYEVCVWYDAYCLALSSLSLCEQLVAVASWGLMRVGYTYTLTFYEWFFCFWHGIYWNELNWILCSRYFKMRQDIEEEGLLKGDRPTSPLYNLWYRLTF